MVKQAVIGQFEQVVLTATVDLDERAYGVTIHREVAELSKPRRVSLGAIYATLDRLEDKGLVASRLSGPIPERGGRSRRYYRLTPDGTRALQESVRTAKRVCERIEATWGRKISKRRSGLKSQPAARLESVIALLVPPVAREHVLGDLAERYESLGQYLLDAVRTVPSVAGSQIRRTWFLPLWPMIAFVLLIAFGRGADGWWPQAVIPTVTTLLAFMLRDAYRVPDPEHPRGKGLVDIVIVAVAVWACQRVVALWQPEWLVTVEGWRGGTAALAILYVLRLQNPTGRVPRFS